MKVIIQHGQDPAIFGTRLETTGEVRIKEAYSGVLFETPDGEKLSVCMRDSGFEIRYTSDHIHNDRFDSGVVELKNGHIFSKVPVVQEISDGDDTNQPR